jgi:AcrR family transcriptional regulator
MAWACRAVFSMNRRADNASARKSTGKQARKSRATQRLIIDTTIKCLAKYGYHETTYIQISEESGISRGAMRHHFPSRSDIMKTTIEHLHQKRLTAFRKASAIVPEGTSRTKAAIEALWQHVNHPMFMVFIDLALAARKDRELAAIFRPAQRIFRQECYYSALDLFPEWLKHREQLRTAIDLSLYMMEGMVLDDLSPDGENASRLLDYLERELDVLRSSGAGGGDPGNEVAAG